MRTPQSGEDRAEDWHTKREMPSRTHQLKPQVDSTSMLQLPTMAAETGQQQIEQSKSHVDGEGEITGGVRFLGGGFLAKLAPHRVEH